MACCADVGCPVGDSVCVHVHLYICLKRLFNWWNHLLQGAREPSEVLLRSQYSSRLRGRPHHKKVKSLLERCLFARDLLLCCSVPGLVSLICNLLKTPHWVFSLRSMGFRQALPLLCDSSIPINVFAGIALQ